MPLFHQREDTAGDAARAFTAASTIASLVATACYNYFFIPPVGTFTIADPANWVALAVFLLASVVVSRLVARALLKHRPDMTAADIAREALLVAAQIDIYTNDHITLEEL